MELCSGDRRHNHEEIVWDSGSCPLCTALEELNEAESKLEKVEGELEDLKDEWNSHECCTSFIGCVKDPCMFPHEKRLEQK